MHISRKESSNDDKFEPDVIVDRYLYATKEEGDAYGNDAEYWHDEYEKVIGAKEVLDSATRKTFRVMKGQYDNILASRNSWQAKAHERAKELSKIKRAFPQNISWPKYPDGKMLNIGDRVKVMTEPGSFTEISIEAVAFDKDGNYYFITDAKTLGASFSIFDYPDPDSEEKILSDAIKHAVSLNTDKSCIGDIDTNVIKNLISLYSDRLNKLNQGIEDADSDASD